MVKTRGTSAGGGGGMQMTTGTYTGDGNATQAIAGVGFQPTIVLICNSAGGIRGRGVRTDAENDAYTSWDDDGNGSGYSVDNVISLDADGFTVGDGTGGFTDVFNVNAQLYTFIAFR